MGQYRLRGDMGPDYPTKTRILIADDDPIVRSLLRNILCRQPTVEVVGEAADGLQTLDLLMPRAQGWEVLQQIIDGHVPTSVIIVASCIAPQQALDAIQIGARGTLGKQFLSLLPKCLECVRSGEYWVGQQSFATLQEAALFLSQQLQPAPADNPWKLTARELQITALVAAGQSNRDIAATLSISEETVKRHLANIFPKCGVVNRVELARFASHGSLLSAGAAGGRS